MAQQPEQFKDLGLDNRLMAALEHQGLHTLTEIQDQAIPVILTGHDLIASSKTGSGKTLAFLLPALQRLIKTKALSKRDPRALILAPTRELAKQVYEQLRSLTSNNSINIALLLGGENFNDQIKLLRKQPHVIVATPGRLANHLTSRSLMLNGLELLIMDEADRMLDLGFAKELNQINDAADHRRRQTLMFSATLDHAQVNDMADKLLKAPKRIAVGAANAEHLDIEKRFYLCDHLDHKQALLQHILTTQSYQQAIIFTATRADTERLARLLETHNLSTAALSGDMSQAERNRIMDSFSRGQQKVLITTDVASRGLDLLQVSLVVNFDMPKQAEEYVHRIGRTGRAGAKGLALSLVGPKDWDAFKRVERFLQQDISFMTFEGLVGKFKGIRPNKKKATAKPAAKGKGKGYQGKGGSNAYKPAKKQAKTVKALKDRSDRLAPGTGLGSNDGMAPPKRKKPN
ncbi:DEAD/DEAH box helicase [Oceanisphaera pacifica]|uniref:DEAD/DEAH box helicase n=1 Tax=Oceanisphaera pacifica TaxID=2818389 RepID=A0ABS3NHA9_9GAMM|nr:DEAD/DEAH box helicase [Oceanisphaera pacifica]MBO1519783.1 DEAD/DEAH box helicase [Oceanisphaera pacifica]